MKMIYGVKDKPKAGQLIVFSLQQLLAILAATILVPIIINGNPECENANMSISAALVGAGVGTIIYLLFTKFKSPVFLGSSFAFLGSMAAAFAGGVSAAFGNVGLLIGAVFAGLVYVIIAVIVKFAGVKWIDKIMPAVVIGPTVAIIGLSLAGNAVGQLAGGITDANGYVMDLGGILRLVCGLATLAVTIVCSVFGKKLLKMIPFVIGILSGYVLAAILTAFSYIPTINATAQSALRIIDFTKFANMEWYPNFAFLQLFGEYDLGTVPSVGSYIGKIALAYIPVAFVVFAEHIADHKNISSIIETDLLKDPGLHRTLLGDGVGSIAGALFGGCPNTTYGESVGCVAISGNASVRTIFLTACMAIVCAFIAPFVTFLATIPDCVMGGVCVALYGFIAVSGLKMVQKVDLGDNKNLFVVAVVLITGVGGMSLSFGNGAITITEVACALILGILANLLVNIKSKKNKGDEQLVIEEVAAEQPAEAVKEEQPAAEPAVAPAPEATPAEPVQAEQPVKTEPAKSAPAKAKKAKAQPADAAKESE